jgi:hypothetical protein
MRTGLRVNERGIAGSVRSLDVDVGFDNFEAGGYGSTSGRGNASGHAERHKVAPVLEIVCIVRHFVSPFT